MVCGFCGSEHNYRGGPRINTGRGTAQLACRQPSTASSPLVDAGVSPGANRFLSSAIAKGSHQPWLSDAAVDLELLLRRIIREETGITAVAPAEKWRGGSLVLRPGTPGLQEKCLPIETFFHKIVMLRNRLRTLEQQVNASELPEDVKVKLQGYVTAVTDR